MSRRRTTTLSASSDVWCQIFADVLDRPIDQVADPLSANVRGAAFVAAVGLGLQASGPLSALMLFAALFAGTALYTLPLAFVEPIRRRRWLSWAMRGIGVLICAHLVAVGIGTILGPV